MRQCHDIQPQLSAFVDRELDAAARARIEAHVQACDECRALAADLTRLRDAARTLGPVRPPDHVWLEVAGQIRLREPRVVAPAATPRPRPVLWQWAGLAAALVVVTLGAYYVTRLPDAPAPPPAGNVERSASVEAFTEQLRLAIEHSERASAELEALIRSGDGSLDPALADTLQRNLAVVDQAIAESRAALTDEPSSLSARASLFEALSRKITVLQSTVLLMNEMRQGNAAGAARATEALRKSS
jgi:anti-sigma factor RsiW